MSLTTDRFVIRTVRHGAVIIGGKTFRPENPEAVGRLEGRRMAFGRYTTAGQFMPYVFLWGTERMYRAPKEDKDTEGSEYLLAWREFCKLASDEPVDALHMPNGYLMMDQQPDGTWLAYPSLGLVWWDAE